MGAGPARLMLAVPQSSARAWHDMGAAAFSTIEGADLIDLVFIPPLIACPCSQCKMRLLQSDGGNLLRMYFLAFRRLPRCIFHYRGCGPDRPRFHTPANRMSMQSVQDALAAVR